MAGIENLAEVLKSLEVSCDDIQYGFASVESLSIPLDDEILGIFREKEGLTLIAPKKYFEDRSIPHEGPFAMLIIEVHTSLTMVGLTAALATQLANNHISANVYAAFYHDHIFVQHDLRTKAVDVINRLKN